MNNRNCGVGVTNGPQEAIAEMDKQSANDFLAGKGNDPVHVIGQLEERLSEEDED